MNRQLADNEDRRKNLHDFKKKICGIKKNFTDFRRFLWKKQLKMLLFLRFFEEILGALKRVYMILHLNTEPRVSRKNVKKVTKKVLT